MRYRRFLAITAVAAVSWSGAGCIPPRVVPDPLLRQVDRTVSFAQLKQEAEQHKGALVALGGAVLSARLLQEGTLIEVLQLPLDPADRPAGPFEISEGRFLLIDPGRRDPAVLLNRRITVVGEVIGTKIQRVDEFEYVFPYLSARFIHVWGTSRDMTYDAYYPYSYPYYYPYPYPRYPYIFLDLSPTWYGPSWYDGPHGGPRPSAPPPRGFEAPPGGNPSSPPPQPPAPSPGGGMRRRF
jgi:starvation-inducible outer membrane lipoprotein